MQLQNLRPFISSIEEAKKLYEAEKNCQVQKIHTHDEKIIFKQKGSYYKYMIPPNWDLAEKHQVKIFLNKHFKLAGQIGHKIQIHPDKEIEVCPCCLLPLQKKEISLLEDEMVLSFLGPGYPLYFNFIRFAILIMGILFLTSGEFSLSINLLSNDCSDYNSQIENQENAIVSQSELIPYAKNICENDFIARASIASRRFQHDLGKVSDILNISSQILIMILLFFFRKSQIQINGVCDMQDVTPSDYTLMLEDLPVEEDIEQKIRLFFQNLSTEEQEIQVTQINLVYLMDQLDEYQMKETELVKQKQLELSKETFGTDQYFEVMMKWDNQIYEQKKIIQKHSEEIRTDYTKFTGTAFVSFQTEDQKQHALEKSTQKLSEVMFSFLFGWLLESKRRFDYHGKRVNVSVAPEPLDIIWQNIVHNENKRLCQRISGFLLSTIIISIFFITLLYIAKWQSIETLNIQEQQNGKKNKVDSDSRSSHIQAFLCSLFTVFINSFVVSKLNRFLVNFESYETYSQYNVSLASKLSLTLFVNSALIAYFASTFFTGNIFGQGGLIYIQYYFFLTNSIMQALIVFIDPNLVNKKINIWLQKRKGDQCTLTQEQANQLFEYPEHQIELRYADIMKTLFMTFFYAPLVPIGYITSLLGLIVYLQVEKYVLLRRLSVKHTPSVQLSILMTEIFEYLPIIFAISSLLFKYQILGYFSWSAAVGLCIGILNAVLPLQVLAEMLFPPEEENESMNYNEALLQFQTNYDKENPITKQTTEQKILEKGIQGSKYINIDQCYDYGGVYSIRKESIYEKQSENKSFIKF